MPTDAQLAARQNPTPVNINIPGEGQVWRDSASAGGSFYYSSGGKVYSVDLSTIGKQAYGQNIDSLGGAYNYRNGTWDAGIKALKDNYGIDYNSIGTTGSYNMADLQKYYAGQGDPNVAKGLIGKTAGPSSTQTLNGPDVKADIAAHPVVPNTPGQTTQPTNNAANPVAVTNAPPGSPQNGGPNAQANTPSGTTPAATPTPGGTPAAPAYTGPSIVDYLSSVGHASDFNSRAALASQYGIQNYSGTAAQNTQLLNTLRTQNPSGTSSVTPPITTPTGTTSSTPTTPLSASDKYAGMDPISKQVAMYQDTYKALGLDTIKQQWDSYNKQLSDITNELNDKITAVQNNPWMAQSVVDRNVAQLKNSYSSKIDTFTNLAKLAETAYTAGTAQIDHIVSGANADIAAANKVAQDQIDAANALAKDNEVVSIGGNEVLVNKQTGKKVAILGPTPKSTQTPALSVSEKQAQGFQKINQILDTKNSTVGETYVDSNGLITAKGFSTLLDAGQGAGISRAEFLDRYSSQMFQGKGAAKSYGLTPAEATKYGFE